MSRANEPAYPTPWHNDGDLNVSAPNGEVVPPQGTVQLQGLTIREEFAALAMQGLLAYYGASSFTPEIFAKWARERADALIAELAKVKP